MDQALPEDIQAFLQLVESLQRPSLESIGADVARTAVKAMAPADMGERRCRIEEKHIPVTGGQIPIRVYQPETVRGVVVFFHGGGWVLCDLDTHDAFADQLAHGTGHVVVSVGYRLAPEHPYPTPLEDAYTALCWVSSNIGKLAPGCSTVAIAGDSAGGNLASACCLKARDERGPCISHQLLFYPVMDISTLDSQSYTEFSEGYYLRKSDMVWFAKQYLGGSDSANHPYISPLQAADFRTLPPAYLITAGFDVLRDEGALFAKELQRAGVPVHYACYPDMIHGFLTMASTLPSAQAATANVLQEIATLLNRDRVPV
ncbi:alpha/beta hydrolase [Biformimicrobium ophioploci]|uniref:Alpha/beta hydrolase n=1 Tax=Biformimicrobium ophioploci TaxID=3036711 RepID=A0ABQ6LVL5_9GAMM|nr:alpha/beta hydrolase [Microbulbifer sp. NKW57]GMG86129.1 alpha/beta hydrolase [Microbulbifer sp. NKW57]